MDNITFADNGHLKQFFSAANWMLSHQDGNGGWPIMVRRYKASGLLKLEPGWYSAMSQGQAISLLVRAYLQSNDQQYFDAAVKGTKPFNILSSKGGVLAKFAGQFIWYEEYPTVPSSFVLNGFIYSLFGLYDLQTITSGNIFSVVKSLYTEGIRSLISLLPLYDTGSGTVYDLRHFSLGIAPNIARWDYHTTHIMQLLWLGTFEDDLIFNKTAKRWISYIKGYKAPHN